ncbi:2Fe-2S iron-sulfur cluster-binding protein [Pseudaquidulcibacter saccharophilus]|uniref:2Fe-2S iron-sulfur cluster-binding protein n=1 Tax=Pseudaquidulcibacter saccharophilus TaxID=2831900 RepID=UPI001EFF0197|nr:2Fe-2S iron-sulfur cluster-binding protein [Pseudaquidulcibacter saccharophilus]
MTEITFIEHNGKEHKVDAAGGGSVMEAAVKNNIPGIDADCGGACACATCHVYVDEKWLDKINPMGSMEESMLDFAENVQPNSRLSCQIVVNEDLEGLVVTIPESQG